MLDAQLFQLSSHDRTGAGHAETEKRMEHSRALGEAALCTWFAAAV